jgi:hypothetical protein
MGKRGINLQGRIYLLTHFAPQNLREAFSSYQIYLQIHLEKLDDNKIAVLESLNPNSYPPTYGVGMKNGRTVMILPFRVEL